MEEEKPNLSMSVEKMKHNFQPSFENRKHESPNLDLPVSLEVEPSTNFFTQNPHPELIEFRPPTDLPQQKPKKKKTSGEIPSHSGGVDKGYNFNELDFHESHTDSVTYGMRQMEKHPLDDLEPEMVEQTKKSIKKRVQAKKNN